MIKRIWIGLWLFMAAAVSGKAQFWKNDTIEKKEGFFVIPLLYYTPDTRWAAGAAGVYYFNTAKNKENPQHDTRLSYFKLLGDYTQNRQVDFWADWNIFTYEEKWLFKGEVRYRNFPDSYYGIGNRSLEEAREKYTYDYYSIKFLATKRLGKYLFAGLDYGFENEYNFQFFENKELASGTVTGYQGGVGSAFGVVVTHDSRDNVVNAYSGSYAQLSTYYYNPVFGSTFNFKNINGIWNTYTKVGKNSVIATNVAMILNFGEVPFLDLAKVGNDDLLRGYPRNRFRDKHFLAGQVEYRFPIYNRIGGVTFAGLGDVFSNVNQLGLDWVKYSWGGGLRYAINQKERLNIRLDYGFGRGESSFYFMVTESF